jgi:head-tail adaptor
VLRDCVRDGKLNKRYTLTLLKRTKRHIPADVAEYSDCKRVIAKAIKKAQRKHHHRSARHHGR